MPSRRPAYEFSGAYQKTLRETGDASKAHEASVQAEVRRRIRLQIDSSSIRDWVLEVTGNDRKAHDAWVRAEAVRQTRAGLAPQSIYEWVLRESGDEDKAFLMRFEAEAIQMMMAGLNPLNPDAPPSWTFLPPADDDRSELADRLREQIRHLHEFAGFGKPTLPRER